MQKLILYLTIIALICVISCGSLYLTAWKDSDSIAFLKGYGWEVKKTPIEKVSVTIPSEFDDIYENYNIIQLQAGLDLYPYRGKTGTRYTYEVTNYPEDPGVPVRANIIVIDNKAVAGDIMTTSLGGFMHSLNHEK